MPTRPTSPMQTTARAMLAAFSMLVLQGCTASPSSTGPTAPVGATEFTVEPGDYDAAFNAARDTVRGLRFDLDRIDARAGVVTSRPKRTAGLATPWDPEQMSLSAEVADTLNMSRRLIRITFHRSDDERAVLIEPSRQAASFTPRPDLRSLSEPMTLRVRVDREIVHRPGWRISSSSIRRSSTAVDPELQRRDIGGWFSTPEARDVELEHTIAKRIRSKIERASRAR